MSCDAATFKRLHREDCERRISQGRIDGKPTCVSTLTKGPWLSGRLWPPV